MNQTAEPDSMAAQFGKEYENYAAGTPRFIPKPGQEMRIAPALLFASGLVVMGIGLYFIFFRPPLLPEDIRYIGGTMESIRAGAPGLAAWLGRVFLVMGGYIFATGLLTTFIGVVLFRSALPGAWMAASFAGITSIGLMAAVNFVIDSDFKWFLFSVAVLWLCALLLHFVELRWN